MFNVPAIMVTRDEVVRELKDDDSIFDSRPG